jgi:hypothetical protein
MKRAAAVLLPCLVGACSAWPSGSYVQSVSDADAAVLAPAIAGYLSSALPAGSTVAVVPAEGDDPIVAILAADLDRDGIKQAQSGTQIRYLADALDSGVMLRVSISDREGASQYFAREPGGAIIADGPITVMQP